MQAKPDFEFTAREPAIFHARNNPGEPADVGKSLHVIEQHLKSYVSGPLRRLRSRGRISIRDSVLECAADVRKSPSGRPLTFRAAIPVGSDAQQKDMMPMSMLRDERLRALHSQFLDAAKRFPYLTCAAVTPRDSTPLWPKTPHEFEAGAFRLGLSADALKSLAKMPNAAFPQPVSDANWLTIAGCLWESVFYSNQEPDSNRSATQRRAEAEYDRMKADFEACVAAVKEFKQLARLATAQLDIDRRVDEMHEYPLKDDPGDRWLERILEIAVVETEGPLNTWFVRRLAIDVFSASARAIERIDNDGNGESFTLHELLLKLGESEWCRQMAERADSESRASGAAIYGSKAAHHAIRASQYQSDAAKAIETLHSRPATKCIQTVCFANGKDFTRQAVLELCAGAAIAHGKTLDDLLLLDADAVAEMLTTTANNPAIAHSDQIKLANLRGGDNSRLVESPRTYQQDPSVSNSEGLHPIANCDKSDRQADIVFIHGLGGASHSTWGHNEVAQFFWPEELGLK